MILENLSFLLIAKGGLISEGPLTLVPNLAPQEKVWISRFTVNNLFKISVQGQHLAPFLAMEPKSKYLLR